VALQGTQSLWTAETFGQDLIDMTVGGLLDAQAARRPDKEALVYNYPEVGIFQRLTYRQLRDEANVIAKGLIALGVKPEDKVAVLATNVPEWVVLEMALPKAGAILITVNTNYQRAELEYLLRQADVHTLILIAQHRGNSYVKSLRQLMPELDAIRDPATEEIRSANFPFFRRAILIGPEREPGILPYACLTDIGASLTDRDLAERQSHVRTYDVSQIQFTSGTTGAPKGAMITHHGSLNNARFVAWRARLTSDDRYLSPMPLFHTAGNVVDQLSMLVCGGTVIKAIEFNPAKMLELIQRERATVMNAVPTMIIAMLQEPRFLAGEFDVSSLKQVITGGTSIPVPLMMQMKANWGADPTIVLGMTEASPIITQTLPDDTFEKRSATTGIPLPHTEVKVVDGEGNIVPVGASGEILIRGYNVTKGYYGMPEQTAKGIDGDGWLHSGDLASIDAEGYVRIVGRLKDMFIRGGENIYPAEVEVFLLRHPKIRQAEVVGVPDAYMGEEGAAFVMLRDGIQMAEDEIKDYCRANLSRHKLPKYFRFMTEYPLTPSGKVKKFELRERLIKELGLK
jgi:fatty-acyl-CoA synthase